MNPTSLKLHGTRVLIITGDTRFGPGNERYELQKAGVETLHAVYWGRGSYWPKVPKGFDVVTVQDPFWRGVFGLIAARRTRAKFNVQVHTDLSAHSFVRHILSQIVLRHADSIRVVSEKIKKQVEHIGVRAKVSVLPIFVDIESFKQVQHQPQSHKTILWLGRFEGEKDPIGGIRVFAEVHDKMPNTTLFMLGTGSLEGALRDKAKQLPQVEFLGWRADTKPYLAMADLVLCTSRHESYGASIIEALAAGVPVVAPDVGVAEEAGAIVVSRGDMAKKIVEVLQSGERGNLKLKFPTREEWASAWKNTL